MEDLFGCAGVGSVPEGMVVSSALHPGSQPEAIQPTSHTPVKMPAPAAQITAPAPTPSAVSASSTRPRPATQESLLNTYTAHAERRTAALESLVRPDLESWRRLKERRRRRFENKVLSKLAEISETLKDIAETQKSTLDALKKMSHE